MTTLGGGTAISGGGTVERQTGWERLNLTTDSSKQYCIHCHIIIQTEKYTSSIHIHCIHVCVHNRIKVSFNR